LSILGCCGEEKRQIIPPVAFKLAIAESFWQRGLTLPQKRGHPGNSLQSKLDAKKKKGPTAVMPQPDVRKNGVSHLQGRREGWKAGTNYLGPDSVEQGVFFYNIRAARKGD
jgi:hypothetical protein